MATLQSIQTKIDGASTKFVLTDRTIYKRVVSRSGGNQLIGQPGSVDPNDTELKPQPFYSRPDSMELGAIRAPDDVLSSDGTAGLSNTEYVLFFTPNCMSLSDIQNPDVTLVFKDVQGNEEQFRIIDYETLAFQGGTFGISAYVKSFKKQAGTTNSGG